MTIELADGRIGLREWTIDDVEAMHRWFSNPRVTRFLTWGGSSKEESRNHLHECMSAQSDRPRRKFFFAVQCNSINRIIGDAGFQWVDNHDDAKVGELGYFLKPDYWGRGIGTEVASLIMNYAFEMQGADVMRASCDRSNVASERVLQKCGFEPTSNQGSVDRRTYQITRERWSTQFDELDSSCE